MMSWRRKTVRLFRQRIRLHQLGRKWDKLCRHPFAKASALLVAAFIVTITLNFLIILLSEDRRKLELDRAGDGSVNTSAGSKELITLKIVSSESSASVSVGGVVVMEDEDEGDRGRGIHVVILNEKSGAIMGHQVFDTCSVTEDEALVTFLRTITKGRLVILAIKDEGSQHLKTSARDALQQMLGLVQLRHLKWRDMWIGVSHLGGKNWCEAISPSLDSDSWGPPLSVTCHVPRSPQEENCLGKWPLTEENGRRREFCRHSEGYGSVCDCRSPSPISFTPAPIRVNSIQDVPVVVIAGNRPYYLFRTLRSLLSADGVNPNMVTVFIDGFVQEPMRVVRLFGLRGVWNTPRGRYHARVSQHYKASLTKTFAQHPQAGYAIVLEDDLDVSPDFFFYFSQLKHLLDDDPSIYCISAWNDYGYRHTSWNAAQLYRVDTMPGLGWMLTSRLFKEELEPHWPHHNKNADWDVWMRSDEVRRGRECVIPDVPRTFHFGSKGFNMNLRVHELYFSRKSFNNASDVQLENVDSLIQDNYERLIESRVMQATLLNHTISPCHESFVPNEAADPLVVFIKMENEQDTETWTRMASCFKVWDLDGRGSHRGLWQLYLKNHPVMIIGSPYSPYSRFKPTGIVPLIMES